MMAELHSAAAGNVAVCLRCDGGGVTGAAQARRVAAKIGAVSAVAGGLTMPWGGLGGEP